MLAIKTLAEQRPYLFCVGLFIVHVLLALPFVIVFKVAGLDIVPLRLIIPIVESAFMVWIIWYLGWFRRAGFSVQVRDIHLYWYPVLIAFVPVLAYGTVSVSAGLMSFYLAALLFTGISEEAFARGVLLPALLSRGKWRALFFAAALFSAGHITNLFFEDFDLLEWTDKFMATFGFAILYGAVFIRTGNIWPLMILHMIHDYSYVASGTAGPTLVVPIDPRLHLALSLANIAYGVFILSKAAPATFAERTGRTTA